MGYFGAARYKVFYFYFIVFVNDHLSLLLGQNYKVKYAYQSVNLEVRLSKSYPAFMRS